MLHIFAYFFFNVMGSPGLFSFIFILFKKKLYELKTVDSPGIEHGLEGEHTDPLFNAPSPASF